MARKTYMTVETTLIPNTVCFSFQSNVDVENGAIVGKGDLVTGEDSIYTALDDYSDGMYLVANPAWSYDTSHITNQNEENFINEAGIPYRVYKLVKDDKYKIGNTSAELEEGNFVEFKDGAYVKSESATKLKVVKIEEVGFPYYIGQYGSLVTGDNDNEYGNSVDAKVKKYTIEVQ